MEPRKGDVERRKSGRGGRMETSKFEENLVVAAMGSMT